MSDIMIIPGNTRQPVRNRIIMIVVWLGLAAIFCPSCESKKPGNDTTTKIEQFLKTIVADTLEKDYHSHKIDIYVLVTNLKIDNLTVKDTYQDAVYFAVGKVTYIIKGKRQWKDKDGNIIQLDPEQEITHWYSCGVLEDKYMHVLYKDEKHRLTLYADKPTAEVLK